MGYQWKEGSRFPVSPQVAGERLEELRRANGEELTPQNVVDDARPDEAPLHPCFEWDDAEAAEKYRHVQARQIIRCVRVVQSEDRAPSLGYVSVRTDSESSARSYVTTARAMAEPELREQAIADALAGLAGWQKRYEHIEELRDVFAAVAREVAKVERRRKAARPVEAPQAVAV